MPLVAAGRAYRSCLLASLVLVLNDLGGWRPFVRAAPNFLLDGSPVRSMLVLQHTSQMDLVGHEGWQEER